MDRDTLDADEPTFAELEDDNTLVATCPQGHEIKFVLQQTKFELLLEMGGMALLDGYYREAVSSFAAAVERFMEFYIRVVGDGREVSDGELTAAWKLMSKQSERQLGAFVALYLLETGTAPPLNQRMAELRNDVVHKGVFPSRAEAYSYGKWAFDLIVSTGIRLRSTYGKQAERVIAKMMSRSFEKARKKEGVVGTQYTSMFLNWADCAWADATFDRSMKRLQERRHQTWAPPAPESEEGEA